LIELRHRAKDLARRLGARRTIDVMTRRKPFRSELIALGLRRDLDVPFPAPAAKIDLTVRPMVDRDREILFDLDTPGISGEERELRKSRSELAAEGVGTPYVAVTADGEPCYVQWLLRPDENEQLREYFNDIFPRLRPDEALLEGAFTPEAQRGKGIMPCAMAQIAEHGREAGARWVLTFVTETNIPSLKGCQRAGFSPYVRRTERWSGLHRSLTFAPLTEHEP
jgi:hypothetical protein